MLSQGYCTMAHILLQVQRVAYSSGMVLDSLELLQYRWIADGCWDSANAGAPWLGRVAISVSIIASSHAHVLITPRFLIEGILTFVIGVFSYVLMPAGATQTANWFRGK